MKRDFLKGLDLSDEIIDKVMAENGKDINDSKAQLTSLTEERNSLLEQSKTNASQLSEFKKAHKDDIDLQAQIQKLQDDNKKLSEESESKLADNAKNYQIEMALRDAHVRDSKSVLPFIDKDTIKYADGKLTGLEEQLKAVQTDHDYLFQSNDDDKSSGPKISVGVDGSPSPASGKSIVETIKNNLAKGE